MLFSNSVYMGLMWIDNKKRLCFHAFYWFFTYIMLVTLLKSEKLGQHWRRFKHAKCLMCLRTSVPSCTLWTSSFSNPFVCCIKAGHRGHNSHCRIGRCYQAGSVSICFQAKCWLLRTYFQNFSQEISQYGWFLWLKVRVPAYKKTLDLGRGFCFMLREDVDYWHPPFWQACVVNHWCVLQRSRQSFIDLQLFIPHMLHVWIIYLHRKVKNCPHEEGEMGPGNHSPTPFSASG